PVVELAARHGVELLLRIVYVVDVDRIDAEVRDTAFDLIAQECRSDAVAARNQLVGAYDSRFEILTRDVRTVLLLARGRRRVQRQITAVGRHEDPRVAIAVAPVAQHTPDHPLGSLPALVARRIHVIHTQLDRPPQRAIVSRVFLACRSAQCRSDPEYGKRPG